MLSGYANFTGGAKYPPTISPLLLGWPGSVPTCAHRATTALLPSPRGQARWSPTARVQRGSFETARCTSTGDHLVCPLILLLSAHVPEAQDQRGYPSIPFYRGGSASTETMPAVSPLPSKLASLSLHRAAWSVLDCARRTSTARFPTRHRMPSDCANITGGARYPPRLDREGKLELTKAPRSRDRGCGNSRRFPPGQARRIAPGGM